MSSSSTSLRRRSSRNDGGSRTLWPVTSLPSSTSTPNSPGAIGTTRIVVMPVPYPPGGLRTTTRWVRRQRHVRSRLRVRPRPAADRHGRGGGRPRRGPSPRRRPGVLGGPDDRQPGGGGVGVRALGGESGRVVRTLVEQDDHISLRAIETVGSNGVYIHDRRGGERVMVAEAPPDPLDRH